MSDRPILSNHAQALLIMALVLAGAALRMRGLFSLELHADEALFASWARLIGTWADPMLATQALDKPPLFFYVQAIFFPLLGAAEAWVARLPNLTASILTIPLMARLARNLFGDSLAPLLAAAIVAFSPLLIRSAATVFIDPMLAALIVASLAAASAHKRDTASGDPLLRYPLAAGTLLGLALITKYQALLFVPLHLLLAFLSGLRMKQLPRWFVGITLPIVGLFAWLVARGAGMGLWAQQMAGYGGLRLTADSRDVLQGRREVLLRKEPPRTARGRGRDGEALRRGDAGAERAVVAGADVHGDARDVALGRPPVPARPGDRAVLR